MTIFNFNDGDLITVLSELKSWEVIRKYHLDESKNKLKDTYTLSYTYHELEILEPKYDAYTLGNKVVSELDLYGYSVKKVKASYKDHTVTFEFKLHSNTATCLSAFITHIQNIDLVLPGFLPSVPSLVKAYTNNGSLTREYSKLEQGIATVNVGIAVDELNNLIGINATSNTVDGHVKSVQLSFEPKAVYRFGKINETPKLVKSTSGCWNILS